MLTFRCDLYAFLIKQLAALLEIPFIEASAKSAENVREMFTVMSRQCIK